MPVQPVTSPTTNLNTIYKTEAEALSWALDKLNLPKNIVLRIDNMALCHCIKKGRSNIREANLII